MSSSSSSPISPARTSPPAVNWQTKLSETCKARNIKLEYEIASDRRGGRTAWSAKVVVGGVPFQARYWYDGQFVNNAKEDAAEVAFGIMQQVPQVPQVQVLPTYLQYATTR